MTVEEFKEAWFKSMEDCPYQIVDSKKEVAKGTYDICFHIYCEHDMEIDVWSKDSVCTIKNKEEWKEAMRSDDILDYIWEHYVAKHNKE